MQCAKHPALQPIAINILNINANERFTYSLILIKGIILNYNHRHGPAKLSVLNDKSDVIENATNIANDGTFRILVQLSPGKNHLKLQYCCVFIEITLELIQPAPIKYYLKPIYIVCTHHDGRFQSDDNESNTIEEACKRIDLAVKLVQCLYAEMLTKHSFGRKTFEFVGCQAFYSTLSVNEARKWSPAKLWEFHAKELICKEPNDGHSYKYLGILASTLCTNGSIMANAALGIGDVAIVGSGTLYAWPSNFDSIEKCFENEKAVDGNVLLDDSNGRKTFGGCFTTAIGSLSHEIGHLFDLGHTPDGIMGSDIDYVNRVFTAERYPRILPPRQVSNCFGGTMQQQLGNNSVAIGRITNVRKASSMLSNYHSRKVADLTFLTENCAVLLNNHKWFNQYEQRTFDISYSVEKHEASSKLPIVLLEIRLKADGMCIKFYRFQEEMPHHVVIPTDFQNEKYECIVLDTNGNLRKFSVV